MHCRDTEGQHQFHHVPARIDWGWSWMIYIFGTWYTIHPLVIPTSVSGLWNSVSQWVWSWSECDPLQTLIDWRVKLDEYLEEVPAPCHNDKSPSRPGFDAAPGTPISIVIKPSAWLQVTVHYRSKFVKAEEQQVRNDTVRVNLQFQIMFSTLLQKS
jgi:hypothetical protein